MFGHHIATAVPSSNNADNVVNVAVISGVIVGILFLVIVIIIIIMLVVIIILRRGKKKSNNIDYKQQRTHNTSDLTQHDHTGDNASSQLGSDATSRLETVNALYIPTNVKSLDSLLQQIDDRSRSDVIGCDAMITPNPSYTVNSLQTGRNLNINMIMYKPKFNTIKYLSLLTQGEETMILLMMLTLPILHYEMFSWKTTRLTVSYSCKCNYVQCIK